MRASSCCTSTNILLRAPTIWGCSMRKELLFKRTSSTWWSSCNYFPFISSYVFLALPLYLYRSPQCPASSILSLSLSLSCSLFCSCLLTPSQESSRVLHKSCQRRRCTGQSEIFLFSHWSFCFLALLYKSLVALLTYRPCPIWVCVTTRGLVSIR